MLTPLLRKRAMFVMFMIPGLGISTWITRTPDIRDLIEANTAEMGLVLFGLSMGSMSGVLVSGWLVSRFGTRKIIFLGMSLLVLSLLLIGTGAELGSQFFTAFGLMVFGLGMGSGEVAMNVEAADVERAVAKPTMQALHGMFSAASVVGASVGILCNAFHVSVLLHTAIMSVVTLVLLLFAIRFVPSENGITDKTATKAERGQFLKLFRDPALILISIVVLAMAFTEGSANDWLPLLLVDGHGMSALSGAIAFAGFALSMAIGRFGSGYFLLRFSRVAVVRVSAIIGAIGLALMIFTDNPALVILSVFLWGLGVAVGFPVAISAAGDTEQNATARVAFVATAGYFAFLVGPPLLGFLGEAFGLRAAMIVVLALIGVAFFAARALGDGRKAVVVNEEASV